MVGLFYVVTNVQGTFLSLALILANYIRFVVGMPMLILLFTLPYRKNLHSIHYITIQNIQYETTNK